MPDIHGITERVLKLLQKLNFNKASGRIGLYKLFCKVANSIDHDAAFHLSLPCLLKYALNGLN